MVLPLNLDGIRKRLWAVAIGYLSVVLFVFLCPCVGVGVCFYCLNFVCLFEAVVHTSLRCEVVDHLLLVSLKSLVC